MITALDRERFTEGDCHYLARAIHLLTGWPIYAFTDEDGDPDDHVFILMPDGRALDVDGPTTLDALCARWKHDQYAPYSWADIRRSGWPPPEFGDYTYRRAYIVGERLLEAVT